MEGIMKKQTCSSSAVGMHKNSQTISKAKPKIRIIHIFAPEIIKTDVANFRELVQRLTGKPTADHRQQQKGTRLKKPRLCRRRPDYHHHHHHHQQQQEPVMISKKMEQLRNGLSVLGNLGTGNQRVKKEEDDGDQMMMWQQNGSIHDHDHHDGHQNSSSGGFLNEFADLDGFIQELGDQFPLFPMDHASTNHHHHHQHHQHHHHHHHHHMQYATNSEETHQLA